MLRARSIALLSLAAALAACSSDSDGDDTSTDFDTAGLFDSGGDTSTDADDPDAGDDASVEPDATPPQPVTVSNLIAVQNPSNPLSYYVEWSTDLEVPSVLQVTCGDDIDARIAGTTARTQHEVFVMGLYEGASCTLTAHPDRDAGDEATTTIDEVSGLPDELDPLEVTDIDLERMERGWTLFSLGSASEQERFIVVAIDEQGRYRWMFSPGQGRSGVGTEVQALDEGVLLGSGAPHQQIVGWDGETLWRLDTPAHHDMRLSPFNDGHVIFLSQTESGECSTIEHTAVEMNMTTREIVWRWIVCDHWTPRLEYRNWSHLNTIEPVPGERAVLISSRDQDVLYKVNRDTDEVEWVLGMDGDFAMDEDAWFFRQHAPEVQPDGHILVLDNGLRQSEAEERETPAWREYTRAVEYELTFDEDGNPDRAEVVWEYADESIFAVNRSEADRLPNGNTLIHYVWVDPDRRVILREVTPEGEVVWNVQTVPDRSSYRSERFAPRYGSVIE